MPAHDPTSDTFRSEKFERLIVEAVKGRGQRNETQVRNSFLASLEAYPDGEARPGWVQTYVSGEEHKVYTVASDSTPEEVRRKLGSIDVLVGLTAVEYERDLTASGAHEHAFEQIKEYCAGLVNSGAPAEEVRGVISDTVLWEAYRVEVPDPIPERELGKDDVTLEKMETLDLSDTGRPLSERVKALRSFLDTHFNRPGLSKLSAKAIADYFSPESFIGNELVNQCVTFIESAFAADDTLGAIVSEHWTKRAAALSADPKSVSFDVDAYAQEFYVTLLAKLLAANVLAGSVLQLSASAFKDIVNGDYFLQFAIDNLIETDLFGWPAVTDRVEGLLPIAALIQSRLFEFDFRTKPQTDLFAELVPLLAGRDRRILLGQGATPSWLTQKLVKEVMSHLSSVGEQGGVRVVDPTCGSGSFIVAMIGELSAAQAEGGLDKSVRIVQDSVAGFDIDPLAVVLARANWAMAIQEISQPLLEQGRLVSPPIFLADALSASDEIGDPQIEVGDVTVSVPRALLDPAQRAILTSLLGRCADSRTTDEKDDALVRSVFLESGETFNDENPSARAALDLLSTLRPALANLDNYERGLLVTEARNGLQAHFEKNQFHAIVSNPPWLALSKIKDNPLTSRFQELAKRYRITAGGSSFLHQEAATIFLAVGVSAYLREGGVAGYLLPDSIRTGQNHKAFRKLVAGRTKNAAWRFRLLEMWEIPTNTFKSKALAVLGDTRSTTPTYEKAGSKIPGRAVAPDVGTYREWEVAVVENDDLYWLSDTDPQIVPDDKGYAPRQGADLMPRTTVFFNVQPPAAGAVQTMIESISAGDPNRYLVRDTKKAVNFVVTKQWIPLRFIHRATLSHHLGPFILTDPALAVLPVDRDGDGWQMVEEGFGRHFASFMSRVLAACSQKSVQERVSALNALNKLTSQKQSAKTWVVVYGAGGGIPAAAYWYVGDEGSEDRRIVDQTLYWITVDSENEAIYLTGLLNSGALYSAITPFLPEGNFAKRHIHTWPARFIPKYDNTSQRHQDVVEQTRNLLGQIANDSDLQGMVTPSLIRKRSKIRERISELPGATAYETACEGIIGTGTTSSSDGPTEEEE